MKKLFTIIVVLIASNAWAKKPTPSIGAPQVRDSNNALVGLWAPDTNSAGNPNGPNGHIDDVVVNIGGTYFLLPWAGSGVTDPNTGFSQMAAAVYYQSTDCSGQPYMIPHSTSPVIQIVGIASQLNGTIIYPDPTATPELLTVNSLNSGPGTGCSVFTQTQNLVTALTVAVPTGFVPPFHLSIPGE